MKKRLPVFLFFTIISFTSSQAQYCIPSVNKDGAHFTTIYFSLPNYASGIANGGGYNSASEGYTTNSISAGISKPNERVSIPFNIHNPADSAVSINVRVFADWNADNDFDDPGEIVYDLDYKIAENTTFGTSAYWTNPSTGSSLVHLRFAVREGGFKATSCGGYKGEIEDYSFNLINTVAMPVAKNSTK
jgi:hypothetical protein